MKRFNLLCSVLLASLMLAGSANAQLISEFEPNPAGGDPADTTFELSGMPSSSFDLWLLSLENDGFGGTVDRAANVTGMFDSNGLAVVMVPDLENPSFTVVLTDSFTGMIGDDLDTAGDGTLDLTSLGTVLDSVGVSDETADDSVLYSTILGGDSILFNGQFEPLHVFRDASTGAFYQSVTVDFGEPTERIGIFDANGVEVSAGDFINGDPLAPTYGAINPTFEPVPEPTSLALLGLTGCVALARRRRS